MGYTKNRYGLLGTYPMMNPSIFSFYDPDYTKFPASNYNLNVPSFGSLPPNILIDLFNHMRDLTYNRTPDNIPPYPNDDQQYFGSRVSFFDNNYSTSLEDTITLSDPTEMIQRLNLLLCGGRLPESKKQIISDLVSGVDVSTLENQLNRASVCLQLVCRSSEFFVTF